MNDFDWSLLSEGRYHDMLVAGFLKSLQLTAITWLFAIPLAIGVAVSRLSPWRVVRGGGTVYVEVIRNIPLLAHLLFWYFGVPELLPEKWHDGLYTHDYESIAAVLALTLYTAAYMSEDIRSGMRAVPAHQTEAGRALGLGFLQTLTWVILPQALRITIAPLLSQTLNLWKNTSIATVIGTPELMYQVSQVESALFRSTEAFTFATLGYLSVSLLLTLAAVYYRSRSGAKP